MRYHDREYLVWVVLGAAEQPDAWSWSRWEPVVHVLSPLVEAARDKAAVRVSQSHVESQASVRFGRVGWNEASHMKWAHGSPLNARQSPSWCFASAEVWAPSWTSCEGQPPDVFFTMSNQLRWSARSAVRFNPLIVLAVACDLGRDAVAHTRQAVDFLRRHYAAVLVAGQQRPWGRDCGGSGFSDAIQDLAVSGLFKPGPIHESSVSPGMLADPDWIVRDGT